MTESNRDAGSTVLDDEERRFLGLKAELHERLVGGLNFSVLRTLDPDVLREELRQGAEEVCEKHGGLMSQADRERLVEELVYETVGLGPLEPLMADPAISDILINGPHTVYVERKGQLELSEVRFRDFDHLLSIVQRIVGRVGRRIDEASPMVDARLRDGSRVNAIMRPLALDGMMVSIRRFSVAPILVDDLLSRHSATPAMFDFICACVRARLNIVISGGTGSGKTTLLNALSGHISSKERIITIEDTAELRLQQPHVGRLETKPPNLEGRGEITSRELLRNSLRMRPDRIIIGECRGKEAFDMLQAMNSGHNGSMTTIHANDTRDAITRLEMLVGMAASELPMWFIHRQIASAIHVVVQTSRMPDGSRKIVQISEIVGFEGQVISMHDLFVFEQTGTSENGQTKGFFTATGIRPNCLDRLHAMGQRLSPTIFQRDDRQNGLDDTVGSEGYEP